jgi:hypothetical protein
VRLSWIGLRFSAHGRECSGIQKDVVLNAHLVGNVTWS